jgi:hypothetical protein
MGIFSQLFGSKSGPSERQIARAMKQATQPHGDAGMRVGAMERLAGWKTPAAAAALLRRFTMQVPQASMDLEEKQYTVRLLVEMGHVAVEPILHYLVSESEVTWPLHALSELLPKQELTQTVRNILEKLAGTYTRWPEAKKVMIEHLSDDAFPVVREVIQRYLADDDDDVCIAAIDYLARCGDDDVREHLLKVFLDADSRPRVRGRILDHLVEREWPVKGYRKRVEEAISDPFYLTSKGTVKRRSV